ncbi:hypothetical protein J132_11212 [Termitomyces sp. J132]|nr:hypothetical protein J132_11212 [Termitomyces sp. J132]
MSFHGPLRAGLYSALFIFSVILLGLTAARVHHTKSLGSPDTISRGRSGYYEPITVELLSTSIIATLFSLPLMACLCSRRGFGLPHFLTELLGILSLFVLYLVGAAIFTHKYRRISYCRGYFLQCRIVSAIMAFSWMSWAITLFLLLAALAALFHFRQHGSNTGYGDRKHHRGAEAAAVGTAGAAYGAHEHEKHGHANTRAGTAAAATGTGAAAGEATGHHDHRTGYTDGKGTTGTTGIGGTGGTAGTNYDTKAGGTHYGTNTGTGINSGSGAATHAGYNEGYRGTESGTQHQGIGTGHTAAPETRALDSSGPASTGYTTSTV